MTVNLTIRQKDWIVVAGDSAITNIGTSTIGQRRVKFTEFYTEPNRKFRIFDGVCVVTAWGELPFDNPLDKLDRQNIKPETHSVDEVAELVFQYLVEDYQPHKIFQDEESTGEDYNDPQK